MPSSSSTRTRRPRLAARTHALLSAGGIVCVGLIISLLQGSISDVQVNGGSYVLSGTATTYISPLRISSAPEGDVSVSFHIKTKAIRPSLYYVLVDDCLQMLTINGKSATPPGIPYCDSDHPHQLDLGPYLKTGDNQISMIIHNNAGDIALTMRPSFADPVTLLPYLILLISILTMGAVLVHTLKLPSWMTATGILLLMGTIARTAYMIISPFSKRNHDADAHLEYIRYLVDHHMIPPSNGGWEFWQPPLYYFLCSLWAGFADFFGFSDGQMIVGLQVGALLLSVATFFLCAWIAWISLPPKEHPIGLPIFVALLAFMPGVILQASQVNNDTLSIALCFTAIALLVAWWNRKTSSLWLWLGLSFTIGLGLLTKSTALLLLPVIYGCLLLRKHTSWKEKCVLGAMSILLIAGVSGWFTVYRIVQNTGQSYVTGNTSGLAGGLGIPNTLPMYTTFNPIAVVSIPYNSPWDDATRRQYFWEYFYRSAFFGEFNYGDSLKILASWILFFSYFVIALMVYGIWRSIRTRLYPSIPFYLLLFFLLVGAMLNRFQYPFTPSQDFRYSMGVLAAVAYFTTVGMIEIRSPLLKQSSVLVVAIFVACCAMFQVYA